MIYSAQDFCGYVKTYNSQLRTHYCSDLIIHYRSVLLLQSRIYYNALFTPMLHHQSQKGFQQGSNLASLGKPSTSEVLHTSGSHNNTLPNP